LEDSNNNINLCGYTCAFLCWFGLLVFVWIRWLFWICFRLFCDVYVGFVEKLLKDFNDRSGLGTMGSS
jgi:hypothetical protein